MKLPELLDIIAFCYAIPPRTVALAKLHDPDAIKFIGDVVSQRMARLAEPDRAEVSKWGLNNEASRYPEIRALPVPPKPTLPPWKKEATP
jgi:hypothetical protein